MASSRPAPAAGHHQAQQADAADADDHHVIAEAHLAVVDDALPSSRQRLGERRRVEGQSPAACETGNVAVVLMYSANAPGRMSSGPSPPVVKACSQ